MPFAEKLTRLRKDKGFTQQELAQRAGIGIAQMRRYEKGNSSPTLEVIKNIAKTRRLSGLMPAVNYHTIQLTEDRL